MRMNVLARIVAALLWVALVLPVPAASLSFDLTDPVEAARWSVTANDNSKGPGGFQGGALRTATSMGAPPAYALRRVSGINASDYNRAIVDLKVTSPSSNGVVATAFFFGAGGDVDPDSRLLKNCPAGEPQTLVFDLDQSLLWSGQIGCIRLDPIWGDGVAEVYSVRLEKHPPPLLAPQWDFTNPRDRQGWQVGEFSDAGGEFHARRVEDTSDGLAFEAKGHNAVMQHFDLNLNTEMVPWVEIETRNNTGRSTMLRFYWASADNLQVDMQRSVLHELAPGNGWQRVRLHLAGHPQWRGMANMVLLNPVTDPGRVEVRRLGFEPIAGLGERGSETALVRWRNQQEVNDELRAGRYRPLLVLVTKEDNEFSKRIERELASSQEFVAMAQRFHAVRLDAQDQAAINVADRVVRIPVLLTMEYDFAAKRWVRRDKLAGPDVSTGGLDIMRKVAPRS